MIRTAARLAVITILAGVVVAGCGGDDQGEEPGSAAQPSGGDEVSIDGNAYEPADIVITAGSEVAWVNDDSATHTVTADDDSFGSEQLAEGDTFTHTFAEPGEFSYTCDIHPFMHGTVTVE